MNIKTVARRYLTNLPGWRANRKIVVIESDDWGSIRMPSLKAYRFLSQSGVSVDGGSARFNQNDTLASENDLEALFELLFGFRDKYRRNAVVTALSIVANPDFKKIADNNFEKYYFEPFPRTLEKYGYSNTLEYWQQGISHRIFMPQFHGREHLNVSVWMKALKENDIPTRLAFNQGCWGFNNLHPLNISYQAAFDLATPTELPVQREAITTGLDLFEKLFGYRASYFVPPNGPFNKALEATLIENGIRYVFTSKIHLEPQGNGRWKKRFHYLGQKNQYDQTYLTRNCFFEPSDPSKDWVDSCLAEVKAAFTLFKPAVISTHRVNYIGGLNPSNRDRGLKALKQLLTEITRRWPEVEFMTSEELGKLTAGNRKNRS